ncbi:DNA adenine methylase [Flavobacterium cerinum]|uniref:site-specific DNA-methyltransferase (adenine-specific) n=1 Tax=Flavobacterium cerinum TaxID=2502784 RepID=A0ABY5IS05_9FLAO|nr:DNA adenine methylase [Flavobacterium cerinum]UUC45564.1 DNA adenine methylase [Flavobacterium cerinum]
MILTRPGNKRKIVKKIAPFFPDHKLRIEPFFGAGGSFFSLPKPKYSILNDLDGDVVNLYLTVLNKKEQLIEELIKVPVCDGLMKYWYRHQETDEVMKAVRFLFLSNFTYMGKGYTVRYGIDNSKRNILKNIDSVFFSLQDCKIMNVDFREVLKKISFSSTVTRKSDSFIYMDPCYLETENFYKVPKWTKQDTLDCLDIMVDSGINCAMSEFDHEFVLTEAKKRDLNIIEIGERQNINNRKTEVLITNYYTSLNVNNEQLKINY